MEDHQPEESASAPTAASETTPTTDSPQPCQHVVDDDTENQLGISAYLSPHHAGFSAVLKARYSDFVVHEVGLDGTVARLESLSVDTVISSASDTTKTSDTKTTNKDYPKDASTTPNSDNHGGNDEASRKRKRSDNETEEISLSEPSWSNLQTELSDMIGQDAAQNIIQFFQKDFEKQKPSENNVEDENEQLYIGLPPIKDKDTRRRVHQWIRSSALHSFVLSDTADDEHGNKIIRLWPTRHATKMPNYGKFDPNSERRIPRANQQPKQKRPEGYLQFVLYKENCDTHTAIKQVTQRLNRGGRNKNFNSNNHNNNKVRVGYSGMKDKRGVTTQFCTLHQRSPHEIAWVNQPSKSNWNNNHYGGGNSSKGGVAVVRVGNFQYVNDELRLGSLLGNRFDVVLRNIQTDPSHHRETTKSIVSQSAEALKQGFVNYFGTQRFGKFHDTHLAGIAVLQGDFEKVVDLIMRPKEGEPPKILEARQKWQKRFNQLKKDAPTDERAKAEASCAKFVLRSLGRFMASEVSVLESLSRNPLDYKRAFSCISKTMRMMFLHAVQSLLWNKVASFRIESLGRKILAGDLVLVGHEDTPSPTVKVVTEDDIVSNKYGLKDVVLPLLGTKSERPANESGKLFDILLEEIGITVDMFRNVQNRDLSFPGDYRKLICRPTDVDFSIVEYNDPVQPLLQTDLMKLNGVQVLEDSTSSNGEKNKTPLLGMVVGFTLPSSAYATIALRELMKKPTSSEYQKELGLGSA